MSPQILFVYQLPSPFILQDRDLLRRHAVVHEFRYTEQTHPARTLYRWMLQHRREFDVVFIWFGDVHASVATRAARVLRKPSILAVGGYDVSDASGYGYLSTGRGLRRARGHFDRANRILAVSETLRAELVQRFPSLAGKTSTLPTGVDTEFFRPGNARSRLVLSVGGASEWMRAWVKGWDRVAAIAQSMPEVRFRLIGASPEIGPRLQPPPNLEVLPILSRTELLPHYQEASVYLQASRVEGLPNTLLEAMSSGCVPVVTRVGGMPDAVDGVGLVVKDDLVEIAEGVRSALQRPELGGLARGRAVDRFSILQRESGLLRVVEEVLSAP